MAPFAKGNKGKPLGVKNKVTQAQRHAIHEAFERVGGVDALQRWGYKNPDAFYSLWGRTIPREIVGDVNASGHLTITIERK